MLLSVGDRIEEGTYEVHSRFKRAVNFTGGHRLVSVVSESIGAGPVNIVVKGVDLRRIRALRVGQHTISVDGRRFEFGNSEVYDSSVPAAPPATETFRANLEVLGGALVECASPKSLAFLLDGGRLANFRPGFERAVAIHIRSAVEQLFPDSGLPLRCASLPTHVGPSRYARLRFQVSECYVAVDLDSRPAAMISSPVFWLP